MKKDTAKPTKSNKLSQKPKPKKRLPLSKILPWVLIVAGIIGTLAAGIITYDKIELAINPDVKLACSLDPVISCGSVTESPQASAFGSLPNPFIGLAAFPVMLLIGVNMLAGATVKKRWYWLSFNIVSLLAVIFCHWLFYQSVYSIKNLCLYCMATWAVTFISFVYITLYNMEQGHLRSDKPWWPKLVNFLRRHHLDIVILWILIIGGLILKHFWYYYGPKLGF